jgi:hypothetical protein
MTDDMIRWAWETNPLFRSAAGQRILYLAARADLARKGIKSKSAQPVPQVQRPGSPLLHADQRQYEHRALEQKLNKTGDYRDAAKLLIAQRNSRR